jgi:hypothetical protein
MAGSGVNLVLIIAGVFISDFIAFNNEVGISVGATPTPLGNNARMQLHSIPFYGDYQS